MPAMDTSLPKIEQFLTALDSAVADGSFVRLSLRLPFGADETLKSVDVKPATIREQLKLSFTFHHQNSRSHAEPPASWRNRPAEAAAAEGFSPGFSVHHPPRPAV